MKQLKGVSANVLLDHALHFPRRLWPWTALHAPLAPGHRMKLAAKAVISVRQESTKDAEMHDDALEEPSMSQALQLVHWCHTHPQPILAVSSLMPLLIIGDSEDSPVLEWAMLLMTMHLWRRHVADHSREFLVDNSLLQASSPGLNYCLSRRLEDVDHGKTAPWGSVVVGRRKHMWLKVASRCWLPMELNGIRVLRDDFNSEDLQSSNLQQISKAKQPDADLNDLAKELKKALKKSVEKRKQLDDAIADKEEVSQQTRSAVGDEIQGSYLRLDAMKERVALEAALKTGTAAAAAATAAALGSRAAPRSELAAATAAKEAAQQRARWLREELLQAQAEAKNPKLKRTVPNPALRELRQEVQDLRSELKSFEHLEGSPPAASSRSPSPRSRKPWNPPDLYPDSKSLDEARSELSVKAQELTMRASVIQRGEAQLERMRAEVRAAAQEASLEELQVSARKAECASLRDRVADLEAEVEVAETSIQAMGQEAGTLASNYEQLKQRGFVYGAAIIRTPASMGHLGTEPSPDEEEPESFPASPRSDTSRAPSRKGGLDALIQFGATATREVRQEHDPHAAARAGRGLKSLIKVLAQKFGWPEVAFLRLDLRGSGRLGHEELRMGLLLGAHVDFPALTGLKAEALLTALDRRGAGFITAADLAACRTEVWHEFGAKQPLLKEKFRALPWNALGGAHQAFHYGSDAPQQQMDWSTFEACVCGDLRGLPREEAHEIFAGICESSTLGSEKLVLRKTNWDAATQELPYLRFSQSLSG